MGFEDVADRMTRRRGPVGSTNGPGAVMIVFALLCWAAMAALIWQGDQPRVLTIALGMAGGSLFVRGLT